MLAIPEKGMSWSVSSHNTDFSVFCEWIEASVLFCDEPITQSDVVDCLLENEIYKFSSLASERVESAWSVLRERYEYLGLPLGITISSNTIHRKDDWVHHAPYAFCVLLACFSYLYPSWSRAQKRDVGAQGEIFERLVQESVVQLFPGWKVDRTGWSQGNPVKLLTYIETLTNNLYELPGAELQLHIDQYSNEMGLDLLAYSPFLDNHAAFPILMFQCASGSNWIHKRKTPDLSLWSKVVSFNSRPVKGFAMPYSFVEPSDFRRQAAPVEGVFMDRYRLLAPVQACQGGQGWVSQALVADIEAWCIPHVKALPIMEVTF